MYTSLITISQILGIEKLEALANYLGEDLFLLIYEACIKEDNFSKLKEVYDILVKLPVGERINKLILDKIIGKGWIFKDYKKIRQQIYDPYSIRESNFWKFLKSIGLAEEASERLS